jgi:PPOX class probable FMN-dependent enzyme
MSDKWLVEDEAGLESVIGQPIEFVRSKVLTQLNEAMKEFIRRSPLLFVSTIDGNGAPDVSPKGDPEGFVEIDASGNLLIPERPGNRLAFGFRNILRNPQIGLIFIVPNQRETLRVKGTAKLRRDPDVLARLQVNGKAALLYAHVNVRECFFHCGKALIRSHLWEPGQWSTETRPIAARQLMSSEPLGEEQIRQTEIALERSYKNDLY